MSVSVFCEHLGNFGLSRAKGLVAEGTIDALYVVLYPPQPAVTSNRDQWPKWKGLPRWAWINCSQNQEADAVAIGEIEEEFAPDGYLLDIEGEWVKGAKLQTVLSAAAQTGKPCRASLAGFSPTGVEYDYRELERQGYAVDWQSYFDSGEGPPPKAAVREMYQCSFVVAGWEYRHRIGDRYGWGRVRMVQTEELAVFDSYLRPGSEDSVFGVLPRSFGWYVDDRVLWPRKPDKPPIGLLMGRVAYPRIRVTLDTTRGANKKHSPSEWQEIAASARINGARKRGVSVYLAETSSDDVLRAIAKGAA